MHSGDQRIVDLLQSLDRLPGPYHLEFPDGFDYLLARSRAIQLRDRLSKDFEGRVLLDDGVQDASYCFEVRIPPQVAEAHEWIWVRLSNYGSLAVITTPRPDGHGDDGAVADGALSASDRRRIESALEDLGYELVPLRLLRRIYDGVTPLADEIAGAVVGYGHPGATWWTRFFDYL
ncbi:hypothetical protein [Streptomyces sp. NPDC087859]|uniref:hypothetical protein n=1 Tax=Streptomyces sp. NPDC087859 TaxID=3365812 RepID=UPI003815D007